jgi:hypothetical protein
MSTQPTTWVLGGALVALVLLAPGGTASGDGAPQTIEGEALVPRARASQGRVVAQDMRRFGSAWSGGAHLSWVPPASGHQLHLLLPVERAGDYDLAITYTRAVNHADFVVYAGGVQRGPVLRGFAPVATTSGRVALGRVTFAGGPNEVVVTGTGKDARSQGFVVGIDRFDLTPAAAPSVVRPPVAAPPGKTPTRAPRPPATRAPPPAVRVPPSDLAAFTRPWMRTVPGWRAPARSASPVLEVEMRAASGVEFPAVYATDLRLDLEVDALARTFRMRHALPGTVSAVWQVCRFEPPPLSKGWHEPAGLVAEGPVTPLAPVGTQGLFPIDFADFYTPPARKDAAGLPKPGSIVLRAGGGAPAQVFRPARVLPARTAPGRTAPGRAAASGNVRVAPASALEPWFGSLEQVYWMRVACLDGEGRLLAFPSNAVRVRFGPSAPVEIDLSGANVPPPEPPWVAANRLRVRILEYQPIRWQSADAHKRFVVSGPFPLGHFTGDPYPFGPIGAKLYVSGEKEDEDLLEAIAGAIGDLATFFVGAVNWVSAAYESIKSAAIDAVAGLVPGCDATCRDLLAAGLEVGLAACGLPPDIPDFDALVEMGKGHITDVLVEEALAQGLPGASEPLLREAAERLVDEVEKRSKAIADRGPSGTAWMRPDPDFQYRPAFFRVEIVNPGTQTLRPRLTVMMAGGKPWGWVFQQVNQNLPPIRPGERKEIPVFLEHDPWYWQAKDAYEHGGTVSSTRARDAWWAAYTGECQLFVSAQATVTNPADGTTNPGHASHGLDQPADRAYRSP